MGRALFSMLSTLYIVLLCSMRLHNLAVNAGTHQARWHSLILPKIWT